MEISNDFNRIIEMNAEAYKCVFDLNEIEFIVFCYDKINAKLL